MTRLLPIIAIAFTLSLTGALSGCGKKSALDTPPAPGEMAPEAADTPAAMEPDAIDRVDEEPFEDPDDTDDLDEPFDPVQDDFDEDID